MKLIDIYKTFDPTTSHSFHQHMNSLQIDQTLGHKKVSNLLKIEIIACIFSDNNGIKLEITKKNFRNYTNMWKLNTIVHHQSINEEIREKFKYLQTYKNENTI